MTMNIAILFFVVVAAISLGLLPVFQRLAAPHVHSVFGAMILSLTAASAGALFLVFRLKPAVPFTDPKGILYAAAAGLFAFLVDVFALKAYASGLAVSTGAPLIIGGSIAVASIVGFFMGEPVGWSKLIAIAMIISGAAYLAKSM